MQRILKSIILVILTFSVCLGSVQADDASEPQLVYLPLISNEKYVKPWIGPDGGFVVCMVTSPTDAKTIYAGTWGNGVFKSTDGGLSWIKSSNGLGDLLINSLAIDPQNPKILYAGTYNDEIYKSTNAGETWFHSSQGIQDYAVVYTIAVDPHNPDIIYIGTRGKNAVDPPPWNGIVYRSMNEGINWSPVLENVGGSAQQDWAYDIVVNPKDHCMVFVAMHEYGVFRSLNCGDSWDSMNGNGLTDLSGRALAINPVGADNNAIYFGTWHRTGVYKSANNGDSWTNQYLYSKIYNMDLDPQQPEVLYAADFYAGILKSTNGGITWANIGLSENLLYTVMVNPLQHTQVFVGTAGNGIFRSDQSGSGWVHSQAGLNNANITGFQVHPAQSTNLFTSTSRGGFHLSRNRGESWQQLNNGLTDLDATGVVLHPQNPDQIYLLTISGGLFTCTLPNCQWVQNNIGLPALDLTSSSSFEFFPQNELESEILQSDTTDELVSTKSVSYQTLNDLVFSTSNPAIVYLATNANGVYKSQNGTTSWTQAGLSGKNVQKLAIHSTNSEIVYASVANSATVYTTNNGGANWVASQVPGGSVNDLGISQSQPGLLYAGTNNGLYFRTEGGAWQLLGLSGKVVTALAIHPNQPGLIVAGCFGEVFYTKDGGQTWISGPGDLVGITIKSVSFDSNNVNLAYLGTSTQGVYRLIIK
ncbi:MAG: hypothetical protein Q7U53_03290 [Anaerolineaceae bacterium]|nr:hypothetical protein [Anaerolineaceae bacterium]